MTQLRALLSTVFLVALKLRSSTAFSAVHPPRRLGTALCMSVETPTIEDIGNMDPSVLKKMLSQVHSSDNDKEAARVFDFVTEPMHLDGVDSASNNYLHDILRAYEGALTQQLVLPSDWFVLGVTDLMIESPGTSFVIEGELKERNCEEACVEQWQCQMRSVKDSKIYNSVLITITKEGGTLPNLSPCFDDDGESATFSSSHIIEEFDSNVLYRMPLQNVLTLFERDLSHVLGDGSWTVESMQDVQHCNLDPAQETTIVEPDQIQCRALTIQTKMKMLDGGLLECRQTLFTHNRQRLAQGVSVIRMGAIPTHVLDKIEGIPERGGKELYWYGQLQTGAPPPPTLFETLDNGLLHPK